MKDDECVAFLQWCLPRLGMRWPGFRRVRRQVCRRIGRRMAALGLDGTAAYRRLLEARPGEWPVLDGLCRVTISRFFRDIAVFDRLGNDVLPRLAGRCAGELRCWCAGCASGEEAYSLKILWEMGPARQFPGGILSVLATDADPHMLERAAAGRFSAGSLKDVPSAWRERAFVEDGRGFVVRPAFRDGIRFAVQDVRRAAPEGPFHLILCRNLAFTYFAEPVQREVLDRLASRLVPGGVLVLGGHETLPDGHGLESPGKAMFRLPI